MVSSTCGSILLMLTKAFTTPFLVPNLSELPLLSIVFVGVIRCSCVLSEGLTSVLLSHISVSILRCKMHLDD